MPKRKQAGSDDDYDFQVTAAEPKGKKGGAGGKGKGKAADDDGDDKPAAKKRAAPAPKAGDPSGYDDTGGSMERNEAIAALLDQLLMVGRADPTSNPFALRGLEKAAQAVRAAAFPIQCGKQAEKCLTGVGKGTSAKIDEYIATGKLAELEKHKDDPRVAAVSALQRVHGIGPTKALSLIDEHGITSLDELAGRPDLLTDAQRVGLKYLKELEAKIPRDEVEELLAVVRSAAHAVDPRLVVEACGSFRRGKPTSGDIDVLVTHPEYVAADASKPDTAPSKQATYLPRLVQALTQSGAMTDVLANGKTKVMGVIQAGPHPGAHGQQPLEAGAGAAASSSSSAAAAASGGGAVVDLVSSDEEGDEGGAGGASSSSSAAAAAPAAAEPDTGLDIDIPDLDAYESGVAAKARNVDAAAARATAEAARAERDAAAAKKTAAVAAAAAKAAAASSASSSSSSAAAAPAAVSAIDAAPLPSGPLHRRIDIRLMPYNCWPTALVYFTGSGPFNERMRAHARSKGYTLSEYCVRKVVSGGGSGKKAAPEVLGDPIAVASERAVFDLIGFPWVPPTQRET